MTTLFVLSGVLLLTPSGPGAHPQAGRAAEPDRSAAGEPAVHWRDFDGDGRLDALSVSRAGRLHLLVNRAEGFEDASERAGLGAIESVALVLAADYDGDGKPDLFVGRSAGTGLLLRNEGGSFVDMAAGAGLVIQEPVRSAHWLDEDGDERLDLHVVTDASNRIWRGLEGGFFEPIELPLEAAAGAPGSSPGTLASTGLAASELDRPATGPHTLAARGQPSDLGQPSNRKDLAAPAPSRGAGSQPLVGPPPIIGGTSPIVSGCVPSIRDQANPGSCIQASSAATLGMLYPLTSKLFVDEATGNVGIGTTSPDYRLQVDGQVISGSGNLAVTLTSAIGGGGANEVHSNYGTIGGGIHNTVASSSDSCVIGGGEENLLASSHSTIGGGFSNAVSGFSVPYQTIAGGHDNAITALFSTDKGSTIGGGGENTVSVFSVLAGYATIPGGRLNTASGSYSFAAGYRAKAQATGSFVWGDSTDVDKIGSLANSFNVFAEGGVHFYAVGNTLPSVIVNSAGRLGVGELAPSVPLEVAGTVLSSGAAGGRLEIANPNDENARAHLSWSGDVAGIRVDGAGTGSANGLDFQTAATSRLRILDNGNVGIGTTDPQVPLHVEGGIRSAGASGGELTCFNPNNQNASFRVGWLNDVARIRIGGSGAGANGGFDFQRIGDASLLRILDSGNVGIGTTTPGFDLEVNGTAGKPGGGSWSVSSDARLKKNVEDLEGSLATLLALRGVSFEYLDPAAIGELEGRRIGFIAQEVERVLPDWVAEKENGTKYLTIRGFEALAVEALRELEHQNQALIEDGTAKDARIAELEAQGRELAQRVAELEQIQTQLEALSARLTALER